MRVGTVIKRWHGSTDFSMKEVAEQIGISTTTLTRIEAGKQIPDGATVVRLIQWLFQSEAANEIGPSERQSGSAGQESSAEPVAGEVAEG